MQDFIKWWLTNWSWSIENESCYYCYIVTLPRMFEWDFTFIDYSHDCYVSSIINYLLRQNRLAFSIYCIYIYLSFKISEDNREHLQNCKIISNRLLFMVTSRKQRRILFSTCFASLVKQFRRFIFNDYQSLWSSLFQMNHVYVYNELHVVSSGNFENRHNLFLHIWLVCSREWKFISTIFHIHQSIHTYIRLSSDLQNWFKIYRRTFSRNSHEKFIRNSSKSIVLSKVREN